MIRHVYLQKEEARPIKVYKRERRTDKSIQYIIRLLETIYATEALQ